MPPPTHLACFYEWIASEATVCSRLLSLDAFCSEELLLGMFYEWNSSEATVLLTDQSRPFLFCFGGALLWAEEVCEFLASLKRKGKLGAGLLVDGGGVGGTMAREERGDVSTYILYIM